MFQLLILAGDSREIEEVEKEWEHTLLQNSMDRELNELNKRLEQKEVVALHGICIIRHKCMTCYTSINSTFYLTQDTRHNHGNFCSMISLITL